MDEGGGENRPGDVEKKPILDTSVLKAFVAGVIAGNLNKGLVLGFALGAAVYAEECSWYTTDSKQPLIVNTSSLPTLSNNTTN